MTRLGLWKTCGAPLAFCLAATVLMSGQTLTTLGSFDGHNGSLPTVPVIQGSDGNLYGTTQEGGHESLGVLFGITLGGTFRPPYIFCRETGCPDGARAYGPLLLGEDGNYYGTTYGGGYNNEGTVFRITRRGKLTTIYDFCSLSGCPNGAQPWAGLIQATDGNFYGTASGQGSGGGGTVFRITPTGVVTELVGFNGANGNQLLAGLVQGTDGAFYGATYSGGANEAGTLFRVTEKGALTTLYNFCSQPDCTDGGLPEGTLIQGTDGNFYGTTAKGGTCVPNDDDLCGTVFKITSAGDLTTLYRFCSQPNCTDGNGPVAGLVQATDGNFYGTTISGGLYDAGTIFSITSDGVLTTQYSFCALGGSCVDGLAPEAALLQDTNGILYSTTAGGGSNPSCDCGTVFGFDMGLGPFVAFVRNPAKNGQEFGILGQGLTGTTGVTLNGTPATFTVRSDTLVTAIVPPGATTGSVTVTTPTGVLTSNVPFHVLP